MGSPLRILHVVVNMNRGGAETLIMNLYRNIDRSKIQFDFLTCKEGEFDSEIIQMGGKVHRVPYLTDVGHFHYVGQLNHFFQSNPNYKVVHSHMDKMSGLVLRAAKKARIPVRISHSHNTGSEGGAAAKFYKWIVGHLILSNATNLLACSNEAAEWLFNRKSRYTTIVKNGIDGNQFTFNPTIRKKVREELNLNKNVFVLGHVGRFAPQKNHSYLIDIFFKYNQINNESVLLLVGDGPLQSEIRKKVLNLGLVDKVKFLGVRDDVHRLLQGFDVMVFPSLHEGLPVSLIEAQSTGLKCIISDQISPEVNLNCELVEFLPLSDMNQWVKNIKILARKPIKRKIHYQDLSKQGYEIKEAANMLEKYYVQHSG